MNLGARLNRGRWRRRRATWRALAPALKAAFKLTRFLWLKNPWNLKDDESAWLSAICRTNQPIVRA